MKLLTILLSMVLSSQAFAHTDHVLGEGSLHTLYHVVFWIIFAVVAVKGISWLTYSHH